MPGMPRLSGKSEKIAYKILGVPLNMQVKKHSKRTSKIEQRLTFEETQRVR